jgi:hypothetical protein
MNQPPSAPLTPLQQTIPDVVRQHPVHFSPSGLAKMLAEAESWQDKSLPEYGRLAKRRRKDVRYQVDILLKW